MFGDFGPLRRLRYTYLYCDSDSDPQCDDNKWNGQRYGEFQGGQQRVVLAEGASGKRMGNGKRCSFGFGPTSLDTEAETELGGAVVSADWVDTNRGSYGVRRRGSRRSDPGFALESRYNCGQLHNHRDGHRERLCQDNGDHHFHAHGELAAATGT